MASTKGKKKDPSTLTPQQAHNAKMGHIHRDVAQSSALVKANPLPALAADFTTLMTQAKDHAGFGLQAVAAMTAMKDLTPEQTVILHDYTKSVEDAVSETEKFARARVLNYALEHGEVFGDKGLSRQFKVGNRLQKVTVNKSGLEAKTVEAAIRAKELDPGKYMTVTQVYTLNDMTRQLLIHDGHFTEDELTALEQKPTYRVERSKEVSDD